MEGEFRWVRNGRGGGWLPRVDFGVMELDGKRQRVAVSRELVDAGVYRPIRCQDHLPTGGKTKPPKLTEQCPRCEAMGLALIARVGLLISQGGLTREQAISQATGVGKQDRRAEYWVRRYVDEHFPALVRAGERAPMSLRELERWADPAGHWGWWWGKPIDTVSYGQMEDWNLWLSERGLSGKTRKSVIAGFRGLLTWLKKRGEIGSIPDALEIPVEAVHSDVMDLKDRQRVLDAIPYGQRGIYLGMAWLAMRPREARAVKLEDYDAELQTVRIDKAFKGPRLDDPVGPTKARKARVQEVQIAELLEWLAWRLEQATPEAMLRGETYLFWNPAAMSGENAAKQYSDEQIRAVWRRGCKAAGVPYLNPYNACMHTTLTALAQAGMPTTQLQAFSGKSLDVMNRYAQPKAAVVKYLPGVEK